MGQKLSDYNPLTKTGAHTHQGPKSGCLGTDIHMCVLGGSEAALPSV